MCNVYCPQTDQSDDWTMKLHIVNLYNCWMATQSFHKPKPNNTQLMAQKPELPPSLPLLLLAFPPSPLPHRYLVVSLVQVEYRPVTANGTFTHPVVPRVQVPLYPTECMCESLTETAQGVHPNNLIHSCETNSNCDGVRCLISAVGQTGYVETIVLPCEGALDVMAEDQDFNVVSREVFYQTESRNVAIGGYSIRADVTIIHRDYSMDVAVSLTSSVSPVGMGFKPHGGLWFMRIINITHRRIN